MVIRSQSEARRLVAIVGSDFTPRLDWLGNGVAQVTVKGGKIVLNPTENWLELSESFYLGNQPNEYTAENLRDSSLAASERIADSRLDVAHKSIIPTIAKRSKRDARMKRKQA